MVKRIFLGIVGGLFNVGWFVLVGIVLVKDGIFKL